MTVRAPLLLLLPLGALLACQPPVAEAPRELPPDIGLKGVTVRSFRGPALELEASAPALAFDRTGPRAGQLRGGPVTASLVRRGVRLGAAEVVGDALLGDLTARGLTASTATGVRISSPRVRYLRAEGPEGTASTDAGVTVLHPQLELEAAAARLDLASGEAELEGVVSRLSPSPPIR